MPLAGLLPLPLQNLRQRLLHAPHGQQVKEFPLCFAERLFFGEHNQLEEAVTPRACDVRLSHTQSSGLSRRMKVWMPQSYVSKYESGERRLDVVEFIAVATALGEDPLELLRQVIE